MLALLCHTLRYCVTSTSVSSHRELTYQPAAAPLLSIVCCLVCTRFEYAQKYALSEAEEREEMAARFQRLEKALRSQAVGRHPVNC